MNGFTDRHKQGTDTNCVGCGKTLVAATRTNSSGDNIIVDTRNGYCFDCPTK